MGSKPGGIFGAIANMEQNARDKIDPVMKVLDPVSRHVINENNDFINKPWLKMRNSAPGEAPKSLLSPGSSEGNSAKASKATSGASTGGGGARDMATMPPSTPEGARMRLGQPSLLGVTS